MTNTNETWEKEFDHPHGEFGDCSGNCVRNMIDKDRVKHFIRSLLQSQRDELRAEIAGMKQEVGLKDYRHYPDEGTDLPAAQYNRALSDVLSLLDKK